MLQTHVNVLVPPSCTQLDTSYAKAGLNAAPGAGVAGSWMPSGACTSMSMLSNARASTGLPFITMATTSSSSEALTATLAGRTYPTLVCSWQAYLSRPGISGVFPLKLGKDRLILGPSNPVLAGGRSNVHSGGNELVALPRRRHGSFVTIDGRGVTATQQSLDSCASCWGDGGAGSVC